jgi:tetratricopeptide (TPR) repeat protein
MRKICTLLAFIITCSLASAAIDSAAFTAAVELYNQKKPAEAQRAFEALATANPANADVLFYLGRLALQRNEHEKAVTYLEKAVALSPDDARFQLKLGDAYGVSAQKAGLFSQMGLAKKCKAAYERAVELDPKNLEARLSLMGYYQQAPGIVGGGTDKALVQALEIKKLDPARGRLAVAGVYVADKKFDEAFAEFDAALKDKPDDYAALFQIGRLAASPASASTAAWKSCASASR